MIRTSAKTVKTTMTTTNDRYVTPTVTPDKTYPSKMVGLAIPTLDDDAAVYLEVAPREHRFNYPCLEGKAKPEGQHGYADNGIILEWDMDDADGTTVTDRVQGIVLTEAGDPAFQSATATPGLGHGVVLDGTADLFHYNLSSAAVTAPLTLVETGDFSVEIVFKTSVDATAAGDTLVCCRRAAAGIGWSLVFDNADHVDFHVDDTTETVIAGTTDTDTGSEVHLIATADRDGNGTLYVNGAAEGGATIAASSGTLLSEHADTEICIGADADAGGDIPATVYFVRVYNFCLTAAQCLENYRIMMGKGYPGWVPLADSRDGDILVISKSTSDPNYSDLTEFVSFNRFAMRALCAVVQTATNDLDFVWLFS